METRIDQPVKEVAAAVITQGDKVLLTRRAPGEKQAGLWEFPGGKVEPGETVRECLARELLEELALTCTIGPKIAESEYEYDHGKVIIHAHESVITSGDLELSVHDRAEWVQVDKLLSYDLAPADIVIAKRVQQQGL